MIKDPIKILLADDKKEICDSLEDNLLIEVEKFGLTEHDVIFVKAYTEHAYDHGCRAVSDGFKPDICIFDLVFNGYSGIDLYKYIIERLGKKMDLCIYTGVEKKYEKRKEAEIMASETNGIITIIPKPDISEVLRWFQDILKNNYNLDKLVDEKDPFDLL